MAAGRVLTGFSMPYVARYTASDNSVSYTGLMQLARGVSVAVALESGDGTTFYADNVAAEGVGGVFTGGTVTLTVDGLKDEARKLIEGLAEPEKVTVGSKSVDVYSYDTDQEIPYIGIGFVARYMENGVTTYVPVVITKTQFDVDGMNAATQTENIEFQTQELTATIMRDDTTKHRWRRIAAAQATEEDAVAVITALLS
jgi:phi13 family phage major tail protein